MDTTGTTDTTAIETTTITTDTAGATPNMEMLEDFDIGTLPIAEKNAAIAATATEISNIDEALAGKPYEEQLKILEAANAPKIEKASGDGEIDETPEPKGDPEPVDLDSEMADIEAELEARKAEEDARKAKEEEDNEYEDMTDEDVELLANKMTELHDENKSLKSLDLENQKVIRRMQADKETDTATIDYLKTIAKEMSGKLNYYESSAEVIKSDEEFSLIKLRRAAIGDTASPRTQYDYLLEIAAEGDRLTGQTEFTKMVDQLIKASVESDKRMIADYGSKNINIDSKADELDEYSL